jgi:multiple RNA-binding domain-containing protein 1
LLVELIGQVERIPRHSKDEVGRSTEPAAETQNSLKRKRDVDERPKDPKLDEFMRVMRATARSQVWKDDVMDDTAQDVDIEVDTGESEDDMQVIGGSSLARRNSAKADGDDSVKLNKPSHVAQTDDDWLRSKTSKQLDHQDENAHPVPMELDDAEHPKQADKPETDPQPENMTEEEKILKYRRLYVRNLPFDVAEDDLRAHFATFGELKEVSARREFPPSVMNPDRDI